MTKWTNELDFELKRLLSEGKRHDEISKLLNTTVGSVKVRAFRLGLKLEYYKDYTCKNCNEIFRALISTNRNFCCKSCSAEYTNRLKEKSEDSKNKTRDSINNYYLKIGKEKIYKHCETCGKEFLVRRNNANRFCSRNCVDRRITEETKEKISKKRIDYLSRNNNVKWYDVKNINGQNIKVQGKWELNFANRCNELKILFFETRLKFNNVHYYTPDFYLPKYNIYIEIKGFLYEKDKYKMLKVIEEKKIILKLIKDEKFINSFKEKELLLLENVDKLFSLQDINYQSFVKRY